mgnify:FL=1
MMSNVAPAVSRGGGGACWRWSILRLVAVSSIIFSSLVAVTCTVDAQHGPEEPQGCRYAVAGGGPGGVYFAWRLATV